VILVLRALGVGDLATAVPALRGLRRAFPGEELVLAAPGWLAPIVALTGAVDRHVPADGLSPIRWPVPPPRLAVNLHGRGPQSHQLLHVARPERLAAFRCPAAGHFEGPQWNDREHEVQRWCRLLHWYGIPADPTDLRLSHPPAASRWPGVTVVHPGSTSPARRWPPERFAAVARALAADGHRVVVTGSDGERRAALRVVRLAGLPGTAALAGRTDLGELAALVAQARLVVTGDTGVGHLATAYQTASVVLFGPVPPRIWGPPAGRPWHRPLWHGEHADAADAASPHPALATITVGEVLAAVRQAERAQRARDAVAAQ
jgi:ADP-heptose:LPS heptosyltransferase